MHRELEAFAFAFALTILQRVFSFRLRASLSGRFNIDSMNIDISIIIDVDDEIGDVLQL